MGPTSSIASDEPTVGVFVDGMYLGVNYGAQLDVFDLEAVEILRGPQGTLFGRNVTGGAVVLRSRRPSGDFGVRAKTFGGSHSRFGSAISVEDALIEDHLAGKVTVMYDRHGGLYDNTQGGTLGEKESIFIRPSLGWQPNENLQIDLIAEYGKTTGDGALSQSIDVEERYLGTLGHVIPEDKTLLSATFKSEFSNEWKQIIGEVNWTIGSGNLTSITGYRDVDYFGSSDAAGAQVNFFNIVSADFIQDQLSQELRYAGAVGENGQYTVGIYYFNQSMQHKEYREFLGDFNAAMNGKLDQWSLAGFANVEVEVTPSIFISGGIRYTKEEKDADVASGNECTFDFSDCTFSQIDRENWQNFSPKAGLSWHANEDLLVFASWSRGFRSGGFNIRNGSNLIPIGPYNEETVESIELGWKSDFWDGKARLNGAVFRNKYNDLQLTILDEQLLQRIQNAADATIQGFELDLLFAPLPHVNIFANVGYTDASFDRFVGLDINSDGISDATDDALSQKLKLTRAPE